MAERIVVNNQAANHIQAYLEYETLVGGYDNGKLMSEKEYETFKKNLAEKQANRLYVSWQNSRGNECKYVGPATKCFCGHRFKEHDYLNTEGKKIHCKAKGCKCPSYSYIPAYGSYDFKCNCKHSYTVHDPVTKRCKQGKCAGCHKGFSSTWSCGCGLKFNDHATVVQTKEERQKLGKLKSLEDPYSMGGNVPLGIGSIQKFGDMVDYGDSYNKQIEDMGGVSGVNNRHAPIGYREMQAIKPQGQLSIQDQKKKSMLKNLNSRLNQEKQIDELDHFQQQQEQQYQQQRSQQQQQMQYSQYSQQSQQGNNMQLQEYGNYENQMEDFVKGGISALKLFNTPHQFTRVKCQPKMIRKY